MLKSLQRAAALVALAAFVLPACGGAATGAAAKSAETSLPPADLSTPEGAVVAVAQAEQAINQILPVPGLAQMDMQQGGYPLQSSPAQPVAEPPHPAPPPPPPPTSPPADAPTAQKGGGAHTIATARKEEVRQPGGALDSCGTACSALASMERAADRLCGLTGPGDARCTDARSRVKNAGTRVHAACPACAGG